MALVTRDPVTLMRLTATRGPDELPWPAAVPELPPGAEPSRDAYRPEAADVAFERTVEFLRRQLGTGRPAG